MDGIRVQLRESGGRPFIDPRKAPAISRMLLGRYVLERGQGAAGAGSGLALSPEGFFDAPIGVLFDSISRDVAFSPRYLGILHCDKLMSGTGLEGSDSILAAEFLSFWYRRAADWLSPSERAQVVALSDEMAQVAERSREIIQGLRGKERWQAWDALARAEPGREIVCILSMGEHSLTVGVIYTPKRFLFSEKYSLRVYNAGLGISDHAAVPRGYKCACDPVLSFSGIDAATMPNLMFLMCGYVESGRSMAALDCYSLLHSVIGNKLERLGSYCFKQPQFGGSCGMMGLKMFASTRLSYDAYKRMMAVVKYLSLDEVASSVGDRLDDPAYYKSHATLIYVLKKGMRNTARRLALKVFGHGRLFESATLDRMMDRLSFHLARIDRGEKLLCADSECLPIDDYSTLQMRLELRTEFHFEGSSHALLAHEGVSLLIPKSGRLDAGQAYGLFEAIEGEIERSMGSEPGRLELLRALEALPMDLDGWRDVGYSKENLFQMNRALGVVSHRLALVYSQRGSVIPPDAICLALRLLVFSTIVGALYEEQMHQGAFLGVARALIPTKGFVQDLLSRSEMMFLRPQCLQSIDASLVSLERLRAGDDLFAQSFTFDRKEMIEKREFFRGMGLSGWGRVLYALVRAADPRAQDPSLALAVRLYSSLGSHEAFSHALGPEAKQLSYLSPLYVSAASLFSLISSNLPRDPFSASSCFPPIAQLFFDGRGVADRFELSGIGKAVQHRAFGGLVHNWSDVSESDQLVTGLDKFGYPVAEEKRYDLVGACRRAAVVPIEGEARLLKAVQPMQECDRVKVLFRGALMRALQPHHHLAQLAYDPRRIQNGHFKHLFEKQLFKSTIGERSAYLLIECADPHFFRLLHEAWDAIEGAFAPREAAEQLHIVEQMTFVRISAMILHILESDERLLTSEGVRGLRERLEAFDFDGWIGRCQNQYEASLVRQHRMFVTLGRHDFESEGVFELYLHDRLMVTRYPPLVSQRNLAFEHELSVKLEGLRLLEWPQRYLSVAIAGRLLRETNYLEDGSTLMSCDRSALCDVEFEIKTQSNRFMIVDIVNGTVRERSAETGEFEVIDYKIDLFKMVQSYSYKELFGKRANFPFRFDGVGVRFEFNERAIRCVKGLNGWEIEVQVNGQWFRYLNRYYERCDPLLEKVLGDSYFLMSNYMHLTSIEDGPAKFMFLDRESWEIAFSILPDGMVIDDKGRTCVRLTDEHRVGGVPIGRVENPSYCYFVLDERDFPCELHMKRYNLEFQLGQVDGGNVWFSKKHPGYFISPVDLSSEFGNFQGMMTLRSAADRAKCLVLIPALGFKKRDGYDTDIRGLAPASYEWNFSLHYATRKEERLMLVCHYVDGKLTAPYGSASMQLAYMKMMFRCGEQALMHLRELMPGDILPAELQNRLHDMATLPRDHDVMDYELLSPVMLAVVILMRYFPLHAHRASEIEKVYTEKYLGAFGDIESPLLLTRAEELELITGLWRAQKKKSLDTLNRYKHLVAGKFLPEKMPMLLPMIFGSRGLDAHLRGRDCCRPHLSFKELISQPAGMDDPEEISAYQFSQFQKALHEPYEPDYFLKLAVGGGKELFSKNSAAVYLHLFGRALALRENGSKEEILWAIWAFGVIDQASKKSTSFPELWVSVIGLLHKMPQAFLRRLRAARNIDEVEPLISELYRDGNGLLPAAGTSIIARFDPVSFERKSKLPGKRKADRSQDHSLRFNRANLAPSFTCAMEVMEERRRRYGLRGSGVIDLSEDPMVLAEGVFASHPRFIDVVDREIARFKEAYVAGGAKALSPVKFAIPFEALDDERALAEEQLRQVHAALDPLIEEIGSICVGPLSSQNQLLQLSGNANSIEMDDLTRFMVTGNPTELIRIASHLKRVDMQDLYEKVVNMHLLVLAADQFIDVIAAINRVKESEQGSPEALSAEHNLDVVLDQMVEFNPANPEYADLRPWNHLYMVAVEFVLGRRMRREPAPQMEVMRQMLQGRSRAEAATPGGGKTSMLLPTLLYEQAMKGVLPLAIVPSDQYIAFIGLMRKTLTRSLGVSLVTFDFARSELTVERLQRIQADLLGVEQGLERGQPQALVLKRETIQTLILEVMDVWSRLQQFGATSSELKTRYGLLKSCVEMILRAHPVTDEAHVVYDILNKVNFPEGVARKMEVEHAALIEYLVYLMIDASVMIDMPEGQVPLCQVIGLLRNNQANCSQEVFKERVVPALAEMLFDWDELQLRGIDRSSFVRYCTGKMDPGVEIFVKEIGPLPDEFDREAHRSDITFVRQINALALSSNASNRKSAEMIALSKHLLTELLPFAIQSTGKIAYGPVGCEVRPFVAANTPSDAHFGDPYTSMVYALFSAVQFPLEKEVLKKYVAEQIRTAEFLVDENPLLPFDATTPARDFFKLVKIPLGQCQSDEVLEQALRNINGDPLIKMRVIRWMALQNIRVYEKRLSASSIFLMQVMASTRTFSGTLAGVFKTLHSKVIAAGESAHTSEISGRVLSRFVRTAKAGRVHIAESLKPAEILKQVFAGRSEEEIAQVHAVADAGAVFKICPSNLDAAREIFQTLREVGHPARAVFFFDNNAPALLLEPTGEPVAILASTASEYAKLSLRPEDVFTYFDGSHWYGTDCEMPDKSEMILITENNTSDDLVQALQRQRKFLISQQVTTMIPAAAARNLLEIDFGGGLVSFEECVRRGDDLGAQQALTILTLRGLVRQTEGAAQLAVTALFEGITAIFKGIVLDVAQSGESGLSAAGYRVFERYIYQTLNRDVFALYGSLSAEVDVIEHFERAANQELMRFERLLGDARVSNGAALVTRARREIADLKGHAFEMRRQLMLPETMPMSVTGAAGTGGYGERVHVRDQENEQSQVRETDREQIKVRDRLAAYLGRAGAKPIGNPLSGADLVRAVSRQDRRLMSPIADIFKITSRMGYPVYSTGEYGPIFEDARVYGTADFIYPYSEDGWLTDGKLHYAIFDPRARQFENLALFRQADGRLSVLCLSAKEMENLKSELDRHPIEGIWLVNEAGVVLGGSHEPLDHDEVIQALVPVFALGGHMSLCRRYVRQMDSWMRMREHHPQLQDFLALRALGKGMTEYASYKSAFSSRHLREGLIARLDQAEGSMADSSLLISAQNMVHLKTSEEIALIPPRMIGVLDVDQFGSEEAASDFLAKITLEQLEHLRDPAAIALIARRDQVICLSPEQVGSVVISNFKGVADARSFLSFLSPAQLSGIEDRGLIDLMGYEQARSIDPELLLEHPDAAGWLELFPPEMRARVPMPALPPSPPPPEEEEGSLETIQDDDAVDRPVAFDEFPRALSERGVKPFDLYTQEKMGAIEFTVQAAFAVFEMIFGAVIFIPLALIALAMRPVSCQSSNNLLSFNLRLLSALPRLVQLKFLK